MSAQTNNSVAPHIASWLNNYKGNFDFYLSLKSQLTKNGTLSDKQIACVERAIAKEAAEKDAEVAHPTFAAGSILTLGKTTARRIAQEVGLAFAYRNIEILKTHKESARGVQVTFRYSSKVGTHCSICNRPLTDEISTATGIGPDCAKKLGIERKDKAEAKEIVAQLEKALEAVGEIKEMWLPRLSVTLQSEGAGQELEEEEVIAPVIHLTLPTNEPKTYVYVVISNHDEATTVEDIFGTSSKAESYAKDLSAKYGKYAEVKILPREVK